MYLYVLWSFEHIVIKYQGIQMVYGMSMDNLLPLKKMSCNQIIGHIREFLILLYKFKKRGYIFKAKILDLGVRMLKITKCIFIIIVFIVATTSSADTELVDILLLNSYHDGYTWSNETK